MLALNNIVLSWVILNLIVCIANADNTDVSLSLSIEASKSYGIGRPVGLVARINSVTVTGRLVNTTTELGIPHQSVSIYYKNVTERAHKLTTLQTYNPPKWFLVEGVLTDAEGYYSYVWVPPQIPFDVPEEYEVLFQIRVVWTYNNIETVDFRDVFISSLEYEPPPQELSYIYSIQPFLITGLLLGGATAASLVIFKLRPADRTKEETRFNKKSWVNYLLLLVLLLSLPFLTSILWWMPLTTHLYLFFLFFPYILTPVVLLVCLVRFFHYLRARIINPKPKPKTCEPVLTCAPVPTSTPKSGGVGSPSLLSIRTAPP